MFKLSSKYKVSLFNCLTVILFPILFPTILIACLCARVTSLSKGKPRLLWGPAPIVNYPNWARAMRDAGYNSYSYTEGYTAKLSSREEFDILAEDRFPKWMPGRIRRFFVFIVTLFQFDIFFISFQGSFLGITNYWVFESLFYRLAGKKVIPLCFGEDIFVYRRVRSLSRLYGLTAYNSVVAKTQNIIAAKVDYWVKNADAIMPGFAYCDGLGRIDILAYCVLCLDVRSWKSKKVKGLGFNGSDGVVRIAHSPNSRGGKGTRYVLDAVEKLKAEGLHVELVLLEGVTNIQVKEALLNDVDILAEQLLLIGYGLSGMEGMAAGLPVISNLDDPEYFKTLRRWSFFDECPVVSATPENFLDVLRILVKNPSLRAELGKCGKNFMNKYHSNEAMVFLFEAIIDYIYGRRESLLEFCDPVVGEFPKRLPKIKTPRLDSSLESYEDYPL